MTSVAAAQCCPGDMHGQVTDSNGTSVQNATVYVHDCLGSHEVGGHDRPIGTTDREGRYVVAKMAWGPCTVTVRAKGFRPYEKSGVRSVIDQNLEFNAVLKTGAPVFDGERLGKSLSWEYGALIQGGNGLQDRTNFRFLMVGGHLGKVLTTDFGTGLFKGNIEYAIEVFPLWQSYTPTFQRIKCLGPVPVPPGEPVGSDGPCSQAYTVGGTYTGASITPIMLRYNFTHGKRFMPWIQAAGGVVWTNHKYPAVGDLDPNDPTQTGPASDTSVWNFTPQGGIGAHYFLKPKRSVDVSINGVHISSASLGDKNPGVNASVQVSVGYSWWK